MAMKVKKGDVVQLLAGKDRGKQGRVVDARPRDGEVVVENLNLATRHQKPRPIRDTNRMGGTQMSSRRNDLEADGASGRQRHGCVPDVQAADARRLHHEGKQRRDRQDPRLQAPGLRPGDRPVSPKAAAAEAYMPRLKHRYNTEIRGELASALAVSSVMQVPRVAKITLNMGVGEAKTDAKTLDAAIEELTTIAGQRAQVRRARKSVAQFKIREGMPIGARVTLRGDRMWEFLDRLISIALPRIRDFRGLNPGSFDGRGNYSLGIREQIIFPEIDYDSIKEIRGLDVAITTTAETDEQAEALLRGLGLPIATEEQRS